MATFRFGLLLGGILLTGSSAPAGALRLHTEGGAVWFSRNDVRIPGEGGTRFDLWGSGGYLAAGYRTLEGGADNDSVYTFAWLHYALVEIGARF